MKKILTFTALLLVLAALAGAFCSCKKSKNKLIGTWKAEKVDITITFGSNGKGTWNDYDFTYTAKGKDLEMTVSQGNRTVTQKMQYSIKGSELTLTADGEDEALVLTKVTDTKTSKNSIIGKWSYEEYGATLTYEFKSGGKGLMTYSYYGSTQEQEFTYKVKGDKIDFTVKEGGASSTTTIDYKVSGDTLTLTYNGGTETLKRVK